MLSDRSPPVTGNRLVPVLGLAECAGLAELLLNLLDDDPLKLEVSFLNYLRSGRYD